MTARNAAILSSESMISTHRLQRQNQRANSAVLSESTQLTRWRDRTLSQVRNLRWLEAGWDGPGSYPISLTAIEKASLLVADLADTLSDLTVPAVTPTPYSGVYLEWYTPGCNVAITIREDGGVELEYEDNEVGIEWEGSFDDVPNYDWRLILLACSRKLLRS